MPVRLLHVSDTHGSGALEQWVYETCRGLPPGSILLHTGDFQTHGEPPVSRLWRQLARECTCLCVPGNHDAAIEEGSVLREWARHGAPWVHAAEDAVIVGLDSETREPDGALAASFAEQFSQLALPEGPKVHLVLAAHRWPTPEREETERDREIAMSERAALERVLNELVTRLGARTLTICHGHFHAGAPRFEPLSDFPLPAWRSWMNSQPASGHTRGVAHVLALDDAGVRCEEVFNG